MEKPKPVNQPSPNTGQLVNMELGKIPPQALDLEGVVLGAMMIDKKGVDTVIDILRPESFYKPSHQFIFESMVQLFNDSSQPHEIMKLLFQI